MKISAFTFSRNINKFYYPFRESILSILPIVDEFVIALGKGDEGDQTRAIIESVNSSKIKIVDTTWEIDRYEPRSAIYAEQTDIAKAYCSGDWLFYLQNDEVVHEKYLPVIQNACERYLRDDEVEGLLFEYVHFWGDYDHYLQHYAYPREIRIIRNRPDIHSYIDAQSFRVYNDFKAGEKNAYTNKEGSRKLQVARIYAWMYHYGGVRPPGYMSAKNKWFFSLSSGWMKKHEKLIPQEFDFGPLQKLGVFKGTHPKVMEEWIAKFDWKEKLQYSGKRKTHRPKHPHERTKYRYRAWIERNLLGGRMLGGFRNYKIIRNDPNLFSED